MTGRRATRRQLIAALGIGGALAVGGTTRSRRRSVDLIAHRGFADEQPENTIDAVRYAAPRADAIEVDVRRCGTGELVCFHDETLDRLTDATGRVVETDLETVRRLTVGESEAHIPRLEAVLDAVPADVPLNVELKERGLAPDLLEAVGGYDVEVLASSFDATALTQVRSLTDDVPIAYVFDDDPDEALETAVDLGCAAVHPKAELCFETDIVDRAHARGLDVNAWTIDSRSQATALAEVGVDGVFSDRHVRRFS